MTPTTVFDAELREARVRLKTSQSLRRYERAQRSLCAGVSTSMRRMARPYPLYFYRGEGPRIFDVDGNSHLDYTLAWGPLILGHAPAPVVSAVERHLARGFTFGAQHDLEFEVAERLTRIIPCADLVCYANSGTEIVQVALRLARAATGRSRFLKFEGHYHGWDDSVLVSYHPEADAARKADSAPIPVGSGQRPHYHDALIAEWNDRSAVERLFESHGGELAAVICEPLLCNSGCISPEPGFLEFLRQITRDNESLLIFDEVITGFRLSLQGAQGHYGVTPDLATYAKAVGGGMPLSVLAGKQQFMSLIAEGKVVHAGTLNGNPPALAAANATLDILEQDNGAIYQSIWRNGERLRCGLEGLLREAGLNVVTSGGGPVFHVSFMESAARNYRETLAADRALYADFALALLDEGVLALPDGRWYVSAAHQEKEIEETLAAVRRTLPPH